MGVEVGGVGWQVDELASPRLDELPYPLWPVSPKVVHHHNLTRMEGGSQQALDVGLEHSGGGRSFHRQRRSHPFRVKARKERDGVLAAVSRDLEEGSLTYWRVGVVRGAREVWVPISSTNTNRPGSMRPTSMRHRLLKNSSRSAAPPDLFFGSYADGPPSGTP